MTLTHWIQGVVSSWANGPQGQAVLNDLRAAADGVIFAATSAVAWKLLRLGRRRPAVPWTPLVLLLAACSALCGLGHLARLLAGRPALPASTAVLKLVAAAFWAAVASCLPALVGSFDPPRTRAAAHRPRRYPTLSNGHKALKR
jgi:hypothetical protein